jgi:N-acetyl-anhydromuramyl-L-alanine amidase AmpD
MRVFRSFATLTAAAVLLVACQDGPVGPGADAPPSAPASASRLDPAFARAADEFGVPASLLKAVAFTETQWQFARGEHSDLEGLPPAYGLFALRGDRLERGAQLAGVSVDAAKTDVEASIRAGAALLRAEAEALGVESKGLSAWAPAVARFSGIDQEAGAADYLHSGVYRTLREGVESPVASLAPNPGLRADFLSDKVGMSMQMSAQYGPAIWTPSPNYSSGRSGYGISLVVIHTCAGNYSGCWSWLTNSSSGVSAHYVVGQTDIGGGVAEVRQLVDENNTAWHVGKYWQGYPTNPRSIGIEHGGFSYGSNGYGPWPAVQYNTSVKLTCDIVKSRSIIRDRDHIIGHYQPDPQNRWHDPGQGFPWSDYMTQINNCVTGGGGTTPTSIIVDSNQTANGTNARFSVSSNWAASSSSTDYNTGYYWASTQALSDVATFEFYLPAAATRTIDAWWVSGTNRSATAPFIAYNASGTQLGSVNVNQQANGGKWNAIGTWNFSAGWNKVVLSRWTGTGYVVVADAIRVR